MDPDGMASIDLSVNGHRRSLEGIDLETPSLYVLRNDLGLQGARFGCGLGLCGACTVVVDGRARTSCDLPVSALVGSEITTVEGLAPDGVPGDIQQALIDAGACQCGYCLSGIVMAAHALLDELPAPTETQVRDALEANICRCGIHGRAIRAIKQVVAATKS
jgi:nicotinate dehydrogenase subunit A